MNLRGSTEARQRLECGELAPAFRRAKAPASRTHSKRFAHNLGLRWRRWFMEREHLQNIDVSWGYEPERTWKGAAAVGSRQAGRTPNASRRILAFGGGDGSWKGNTSKILT